MCLTFNARPCKNSIILFAQKTRGGIDCWKNIGAHATIRFLVTLYVGLLLVPMVDAEGVARCHAAGVGATIDIAWWELFSTTSSVLLSFFCPSSPLLHFSTSLLLLSFLSFCSLLLLFFPSSVVLICRYRYYIYIYGRLPL